MKKVFFLLTIGFLASNLSLSAQIKTPQPSPICKMTQEFGLVKVDLEYSRPGMKGRKVFGDLVPYNDLWRTGANASTKITFSDEVSVNGNSLPAKQYAIYTIPGPAEWVVIFYKETKFWGVPGPEDYKEEDVAAKVSIKSISTKETVETFTINLENLTNSSAELVISWENTKIVVPIKSDTDSKVLKDIENQMAGPAAGTYYQAARYFYEEKKNMEQALVWVNTSLEKGGDKFWILQLKSKILAELGKYSDAIATAEKSSEVARKEGNSDYPRANEKLILDWKKKAGGK